MTTIAAGNHKQIYFDHLDDIVITPGSGGSVKFDCSTPNSAATRPTARTIYSAATISIPAGSTVFLDAVGADASYEVDSGVVGLRPNTTTNTSELDEASTNAVRLAVGAPTARFARRAFWRDMAKVAASNQATAWATGQTELATDVVRLSTGELLLCTTAGTSHGATEPTITAGNDPAAITDNTATWWALSEFTRTAPAGYPAVTVAESSGATALGTVANFSGSSTSFEQPSAPNLQTVAGSGNTLRNIAWSFLDGSSTDNGYGANGRSGKYRTIEFETQADVIDIGYFATTAGFPNERMRIWVDGVSVSEGPLVPGGSGASRKFKLTIAGGRRVRNIRIAVFGTMNLQYAAVATNCTIQKPTQRAPMLLWFSDSFGDTESPNVGIAHYDMAVLASQRLGFPHCVMAGVGGTSYSLDSSNRKALQTLVTTTNDFSTFDADAVLIAHGYNAPLNSVTDAVELAAATVAWDQIRSDQPLAPMIVVGPWYAHPSFSAAVTSLDSSMKTQFLAREDKNSAYISPIDGSITMGDGTVIRAAGTAWLTTAIDDWAIGVDTYHPSPAGRAYLTDCLVSAAESALANL